MTPSDLGKIQQFVQQVVEAIAAILELEVMVTDCSLQVVAGSGRISREVGTLYYPGSLTAQLFAGSQFFFVEDTKKFRLCAECQKSHQCEHLAVLIYPINADSKVLGSLCLSAVTKDQQTLMIKEKNRLLLFSEKMAILIANTIKENLARDKMSRLLGQYNALSDSVHEGILSVDSEGSIIQCNLSAARLLNSKQEKLIESKLQAIFPALRIDQVLNNGKPLEKEIWTSENKRENRFLASLVPVFVNGMPINLTISFRPISEVHRYMINIIGGDVEKCTFDTIIGHAKSLLEVKKLAHKAGINDSVILVRGESGTGKELFARAIHAESPRYKGPFIPLNCSAIPETLLESELFGYEEGAFTGARKGGKPGKFELAHGGTLFLDEIGDMPLHLQPKMLRVLEINQIERVGSIKPINVDVRIVAATNRDLETMIENREFRADLYYRLNVVPIVIPPLRERKEDIEQLTEFFIQKYNKKLSRNIKGFKGDAFECLQRYYWPGNVRELENAIEYVINMETGEYITEESLPKKIREYNQVQDLEKTDLGTYKGKIREYEERILTKALKTYGTSAEAKETIAKHLGMSRTTLYRKIKEYNLL